jgi:ankyrin repeat protein
MKSAKDRVHSGIATKQANVLRKAINENDLETVDQLIKQETKYVNINKDISIFYLRNYANTQGIELYSIFLFEACSKNDVDLNIIMRLIDAGADINHDNLNRVSLGLYIHNYSLNEAVNHKNYELAEFLIARGADVNQPTTRTLDDIDCTSKHYEYPLHLAVKKKDIELIKLLIENGADLNKGENIVYERPNKQITTSPLYEAISTGATEIAQLLIKNGANLEECYREITADGTIITKSAQDANIKPTQNYIAEILSDTLLAQNAVKSLRRNVLKEGAEEKATQTITLYSATIDPKIDSSTIELAIKISDNELAHQIKSNLSGKLLFDCRKEKNGEVIFLYDSSINRDEGTGWYGVYKSRNNELAVSFPKELDVKDFFGNQLKLKIANENDYNSSQHDAYYVETDTSNAIYFNKSKLPAQPDKSKNISKTYEKETVQPPKMRRDRRAAEDKGI